MENRQPRPRPAVEITRAIPLEDEPTPQARAEANQTRKGRRQSPETRAKISQANQGKKLSPEHRAKISQANQGDKNSRYDRSIDKVRLAIADHVRGASMSQASRNQGFGSQWLGNWKFRHPERFRTLYMQAADGLDRAALRRDIGAYVLDSLPEGASLDQDQAGIGLARRALRLCYDEDLSTAEASQQLGLDPGWLDQYQQIYPLIYQELDSKIRHSRA